MLGGISKRAHAFVSAGYRMGIFSCVVQVGQGGHDQIKQSCVP